MARFADEANLIELAMYQFSGTCRTGDLAEQYFNADAMQMHDTLDAFVVDDVDQLIDMALLWKESGDGRIVVHKYLIRKKPVEKYKTGWYEVAGYDIYVKRGKVDHAYKTHGASRKMLHVYLKNGSSLLERHKVPFAEVKRSLEEDDGVWKLA